MRYALGLHWPNVIAVARGRLSVTAAREHELAELLPKATPNAILGLPGVVRLLGRKEEAVRRAIEQSPHFPTVAALIGGRRAWLYEDLKGYKRGLAASKLSEGELQYFYMDAPELRTRLSLSAEALGRGASEKSAGISCLAPREPLLLEFPTGSERKWMTGYESKAKLNSRLSRKTRSRRQTPAARLSSELVSKQPRGRAVLGNGASGSGAKRLEKRACARFPLKTENFPAKRLGAWGKRLLEQVFT